MNKAVVEPNTRGIHAGKTGDADELFLKRNCVGLGWIKMPNLATLAPTREAFKARVAEAYPGKPGAVPVNAGQLFRFVHEMKVGDLVVYPSKRDRQIHLGRVDGEYRYDPKTEPGYPHVRAVKWLRHIPRTHFNQGALYEIGSAMSFFRVKDYAEVFRAAIEGEAAPLPPVTLDETVAKVAEDVEETTKDFVLKRLAQEVKGAPLEGVILHLLECMGYHARLTRKNEPSVDIIAHKDHLGIEPPIIKVQVKSSDGVTTDKDVSALSGKLSDGEYGLFVTLGTFSPASRNFEQNKSNLRLIDGNELVALIFQHYERFDARHKGLPPLRRVYVPEAIDSDEE
jgi:restriction system protein